MLLQANGGHAANAIDGKPWSTTKHKATHGKSCSEMSHFGHAGSLQFEAKPAAISQRLQAFVILQPLTNAVGQNSTTENANSLCRAVFLRSMSLYQRGLLDFKTGAINHSTTPPSFCRFHPFYFTQATLQVVFRGAGSAGIPARPVRHPAGQKKGDNRRHRVPAGRMPAGAGRQPAPPQH